MQDNILKAMLAPTNFIAGFARWPNGHWSIQSIMPPSADVYALIASTEHHAEWLRSWRGQMLEAGAAAAEVSIVRASFVEIEEVPLSRTRS